MNDLLHSVLRYQLLFLFLRHITTQLFNNFESNEFCTIELIKNWPLHTQNHACRVIVPKTVSKCGQYLSSNLLLLKFLFTLFSGWGKATCIICYGTSMETLHGIRHHKCKYSLELMMSSFYICCCFSGENVKGHEKIWGKNNPWLTSQKYHRSYLYERQANSKGMVSSSYPTFPKLRSRVCQFPPHSGEKAACTQRAESVQKRSLPGCPFCCCHKVSPGQLRAW